MQYLVSLADVWKYQIDNNFQCWNGFVLVTHCQVIYHIKKQWWVTHWKALLHTVFQQSYNWESAPPIPNFISDQPETVEEAAKQQPEIPVEKENVAEKLRSDQLKATRLSSE